MGGFTYIFTFAKFQQHPTTGETLEDKFVRVWGHNYKDARRRFEMMFGGRWRGQFESEWQANVDVEGLTEIPSLDPADWAGGGMDNVGWRGWR